MLGSVVRHPSQVDATCLGITDAFQRGGHIVQRDLEVASEKVARPLRHDPERRLRACQRLCDRADGAVAADRDHQVPGVVTRLSSHAATGVLRSRLPPTDVIRIVEDAGYRIVQIRLLDLRRIPDDADARVSHIVSLGHAPRYCKLAARIQP